MTETYLKEYINNKGKISLNTKVQSLKKSKKLWRVNILSNNKKYFILCKNIFLCCGSINNINILKKSRLLTKNTNLSFHPMIKVIVKFPNKVNKKSMEIITHQVTEFFPDFLIGNAASGLPYLKIASQNNKEIYNDVIKNWENMLMFHTTFSLGKGNVLNFPLVSDPVVNYNIDKNHLELIKKGLEKLCKLMVDAGCDYIYPVTKNPIKLNKDNYISFINSIKKINEINFSTVHILGGLPMGENKDLCVTDSYGKLHNFENFYINDSSLISNKLLKNPQGTVMAIALRNIDNFLKKNN